MTIPIVGTSASRPSCHTTDFLAVLARHEISLKQFPGPDIAAMALVAGDFEGAVHRVGFCLEQYAGTGLKGKDVRDVSRRLRDLNQGNACWPLLNALHEFIEECPTIRIGMLVREQRRLKGHMFFLPKEEPPDTVHLNRRDAEMNRLLNSCVSPWRTSGARTMP